MPPRTDNSPPHGELCIGATTMGRVSFTILGGTPVEDHGDAHVILCLEDARKARDVLTASIVRAEQMSLIISPSSPTPVS